MIPPRAGINVIYSSANLPQLQAPYLICGFPGSGYVGKMAVDHLIQELDAKHLADIYSTSFPPQVMIRTDGTTDLMKNSIFIQRVLLLLMPVFYYSQEIHNLQILILNTLWPKRFWTLLPNLIHKKSLLWQHTLPVYL